MFLVGLTGNIASGKSTVARLLAERGALVIDADILARRAVEPDTPALRAIVERWGERMLTEEGTLDRAALRDIVFEHAEELEVLNGIVHPEVARLRAEEVAAARARGERLVVCDIPLLFERQLIDEFSFLVLVDAPRSMRLERLVSDRGLSHDEAMKMIAAQMPAALKRARADFVIENDSDLSALERQVDELWSVLDRAAAGSAMA
ncbi:MAG TPA: dephospho-CoA kinase [Gemmatimonadaceae bacterium]|jgi:dephospho-CoA kinase|nr:dephospho-CoA kinase [Gemmatimonadaceae bacterium]